MDTNSTSPSPGTGYLILHVTTAEGALQLEGATVHILTYDPSREGGGEHIATLYSGADGNTSVLPLATKAKSDSLVAGSEPPYDVYTAEVTLEGYAPVTYNGIPIFDGIVAIQPVNLIPLPESSSPVPPTDESRRYYEMPMQNL